jgi:hypothetical protein
MTKMTEKLLNITRIRGMITNITRIRGKLVVDLKSILNNKYTHVEWNLLKHIKTSIPFRHVS